MEELAIFLSRVLLGWLIIQVFFVFLLVLYLRLSRNTLLPDNQLPKTAVILCLRGADPFLPKCLQALVNQNYPIYDVKIIVDSQDDPAWTIATNTINNLDANNVQISPLRVKRYNCSLKCSSLVQAVSDLDDSYKVVAFVDADAVVHPTWLRELVSPLANPKIGATTGNRWYLPTGKYWGTLVRYFWNVSAVLQMSLYQIAWGGTLAIKTELIHETGLLDKWGRAYVDDTPIRSVLAKHGKVVKFVPSLLILNREECDLPRLFRWLKRQLLASRLYHPWWWAVVADSILTILLPTTVLVLFFTTLLTGQWTVAAVSFSSFASYTMTLLLLTIILEQAVQPILCNHNHPTTKFTIPTLIRMFVALPLTQWVYGLAMFFSLWMSKVNWRGVTYCVSRPWDIRLIEYRPYQLHDEPGDRQVSI
ncbi:MAG: glycosyltransferase family 2 protein [Scytonema sp. PMC 1069.18]|nr:glycosyltransferase family 2 protein [Scytonema sp. PMC 1069.18]MEC4881362.1 glycosyltransferase family 2 protein [Scytonema sp. PMC 1070.18]